MKKLSVLAAVALLVSGVMVLAAPTTVTGVLVDKACYTKDKANTTMAHKGMSETCAADCAKKGQQVALVTATGDVYDVTGTLAANKNEKLVPHMSHTVTLTGEVTDAAGKKAIAATALKMVAAK
jgi:hypothetical protein